MCKKLKFYAKKLINKFNRFNKTFRSNVKNETTFKLKSLFRALFIFLFPIFVSLSIYYFLKINFLEFLITVILALISYKLINIFVFDLKDITNSFEKISKELTNKNNKILHIIKDSLYAMEDYEDEFRDDFSNKTWLYIESYIRYFIIPIVASGYTEENDKLSRFFKNLSDYSEKNAIHVFTKLKFNDRDILDTSSNVSRLCNILVIEYGEDVLQKEVVDRIIAIRKLKHEKKFLTRVVHVINSSWFKATFGVAIGSLIISPLISKILAAIGINL